MLNTVHGLQIVTALGKQTQSFDGPLPKGLKGLTISSGENEITKGLGQR